MVQWLCAWVAQLVEHSPEEGRVTSSILVPSTEERSGIKQRGPLPSLGSGPRATDLYQFFQSHFGQSGTRSG